MKTLTALCSEISSTPRSHHLSRRLWLALALAALLGGGAAQAAPLDPNAFVSLGASPFGAAGVYTIDASKNNAAPTLTGPGIAGAINGVFFDPTPGNTTNKDEIAVFTFNSISLPAGSRVNGAQTANSRPIALLSKGGVTLDGILSVEGGGGASSAFTAGGAGGWAGPGGGGGGGGGGRAGIGGALGGAGGLGLANGDNGQPSGDAGGRGGDGGDAGPNGGGTGGDVEDTGTGGAFGGNGGVSLNGAAGGAAYGSLSVALQGGSGGGGGGGFFSSGSGGGGGGGAVEIGAVADIIINGNVAANGAVGGTGSQQGGGGAGGGILIHGNAVTFTSSAALGATGGGGSGQRPAGGGGGGRVHIAAATTISSFQSLNTLAIVSGGASPSGHSGAPGVLTTMGVMRLVSLTVTTLQDEDNGNSDPTQGTGTSLREAIHYANSIATNDAITFDPTVFAAPRKTITLNGTQLPDLSGNGTLWIAAPAAGVEISGNNASRIFEVGSTARVTLTGLTLRQGNSVGGGGIYNFGRLLLDSCTFTGNTAPVGGAIYSLTDLNGRTLTMLNCTLSGNAATNRGGAIYNAGGLTVIDSCTLVSNSAPANFGSGAESFGRTEVRNSIIAGNANSDVDFDSSTNSFQSNGHNLIGDGNATGEFVETGDQIIGNGDPGLAALADNGGPTQTRALLAGSPAIDKGNTGLTADQRSGMRPVDFNNIPNAPNGNGSDIGAFEFAIFSPSLVVTTTVDEDNGTSDPNFGTGTSLREAINQANGDGIGSAITFDAAVFAAPRKTITLNGTQLVLANDGTLSITAPAAGVEISGNNASRVFYVSPSAMVTLTRVMIRNGRATDEVGGGLWNYGTLLLDSCTLSGNSAQFGGAIYSSTNLSGVTLTIRNCTLSGNSSTDRGGGLYNQNGRTVIESSSIAGNTAPANLGSGAASSGDSSTRTEVSNSIISGNANTDVDLVSGAVNSFASSGFNLVGAGNATAAFNQPGDVTGNTDPGLAPLADKGGPTQTRALLASSPARDAGNTALAVDQRGVPRPQPSGGAADKGAFEFNSFNESLIVTTLADEDNGTSDPAYGAGTSLREAILFANTDGVNSTITFSPTVFAAPRKTITLNGTQLPPILANGTCTIDAPVAGVTLSGNGLSRVLQTNPGSVVTLRGLTITGGQLGSGFGGAGIVALGSLVVEGCTLSGNTAGFGGAIFANSDLATAVTLRNCTLSGNTATVAGGGIYNAIGLTTLDSCTLASNTAPFGKGSAVASVGDASTATRARNSILSGNTNTDVDFVNGATNSFASTGWNLVANGNAAGAFNQPGDIPGNGNPGLLPLGENGGPSPTRGFSTGSPAINGGDTVLTVDQRGIARPQATRDDIGAFELPASAFLDSLVVTTTVDEDNGTSDGNVGTGTSLREAMVFANSNPNVSTITFNLPAGQMIGGVWTIHLAGELPWLEESTHLTGPGAKLLTVRRDTGGSYRIFTIPRTTTPTTFSGLTIRDGLGNTGTSGGIESMSALTLLNCAVLNNQGGLGGGVGLVFGDGTFTGCTFAGNTAGEQGGGINFQGTGGRTLLLRNCTLSGNAANGSGFGGAILNVSVSGTSTLRVESCTVTGNTSASAVNGGGITSIGLSGGTAATFLANTIIAGNTLPNLTGSGSASVTSQGYNLASDNGGAVLTQTGDQINTNPLLGPLAGNGGPTPTRALLAASPARDTGGATSLLTDQRGLARSFGSAVDKGAYELQPESYAFWASYIFPPGTPAALRTLTADPDRDGIANGIEQATGRNPLTPDAPGSVVRLEIQGNNLVLQFERSVLVDPAKFGAEQSVDLQTWSPLGITYQNLGPATATTELIQALIPINSAPRKFGRLYYTP